MFTALTMSNSILSLRLLSDPIEILSASVRIKVQLVANPVCSEALTKPFIYHWFIDSKKKCNLTESTSTCLKCCMFSCIHPLAREKQWPFHCIKMTSCSPPTVCVAWTEYDINHHHEAQMAEGA